MKTKTITLPKLLQKTQSVFNKWIRTRDKEKGCISCGAEVTEAGHYYSQGHHSALRYSEVNTNGQCTRCNRWLHGNLIHYRNGLISRYGQKELDLLDAVGTRNPVKKWRPDELDFLIQKYKL